MFSKNSRILTILGVFLAVALAAYGAADARTKLKPGWNLFSPEQDVDMGREVSKEAESQLQILNDARANSYINALGRQLAAHAPGEKYPYQFKIVNDTAINAFALPGGFVYVNRGAIEAAITKAKSPELWLTKSDTSLCGTAPIKRQRPTWLRRRYRSWEVFLEAAPLAVFWRNSAFLSLPVRCC